MVVVWLLSHFTFRILRIWQLCLFFSFWTGQIVCKCQSLKTKWYFDLIDRIGIQRVEGREYDAMHKSIFPPHTCLAETGFFFHPPNDIPPAINDILWFHLFFFVW